ncbi:hypothetical protein BC828DRAFT_387913 [Blastocladiella britannica]|nr:hypothetical protein BC828DRAFT_387913 [Blastocladiella britannica]
MFKLFSSSSKVTAPGAPSTPSEIEGSERYYGLENFGNTCYCNSVLQALYFCRPFREAVLARDLLSLAELPSAAFIDPADLSSTAPTLPADDAHHPTTPGTYTNGGVNGGASVPSSTQASRSASPTHGGSPNLLRRRTASSAATNVASAAGKLLTKEKSVPSLPKAMLSSGTINVTATPVGDDTLMGHVRELFAAIAGQKRRTGVVGPKAFVNKLKKENIIFRSTQQQDAHEFLNYLLNALAEQLTAVMAALPDATVSRPLHAGQQTPPNDARSFVSTASRGSAPAAPAGAAAALVGGSNPALMPIPPLPTASQVTFASGTTTPAGASRVSSVPPPTPAATWIHELFEGEMATETRCLTCEATTQTREKFLDLSIDVEANSSIASCLWNFSQSEMMCHKDKFYCDTCSGLQEAERSLKIKQLPPVLALHLKRFKYMDKLGKHVKLMHRVVFPTELRPFNPDPETADREYDLFAIVVHVGGTPNHGHYVAIVRSADKWLLFDDDTVELISESQISKYFGDPDAGGLPSASASGYILFYQARDILQTVSGLGPRLRTEHGLGDGIPS